MKVRSVHSFVLFIKGMGGTRKMDRKYSILLLDILDVIKTYSDVHNEINQKQIIDILEDEYGYENLYAKRKTVKNNIEKLLQYSKRKDIEVNEIEYETNERTATHSNTKKKVTYYTYTNFRYIHSFTYGEIRLLIDSILFSKHIPNNQKRQLMGKLGKLHSVHFDSRMKYIETLTATDPVNHQLFLNIEDIERAIQEEKQISFQYNEYTVDEHHEIVLRQRLNDDGEARTYIINPYQMVATNGRYYLVCNNDKYDNLSNYRVDRITNLQVLKKERKPLWKLQEANDRLDLSKYISERVYMYQGESSSVKLRLKKEILTDFVDWFGTEKVDLFEQTADTVTARVRVNEEAMRKWAIQYGKYVRVLSPPRLVEKVKQDIQQMWDEYNSF